MSTLKALRPTDLAADHGLSTQAVRNYEEAGILPAAERTRHGYRVFGRRHARALDTFVALVPAHGHRTAAAIMQAVHRGAVDVALALVDESHAQLLRDRHTLAAVDAALRELAGGVPAATDRAGRSGVTSIGPLARRLGIRPATLRAWERAGVVGPRRDPRTGYRAYTAADVRDAELAHQLRRGGYLLSRIAPVVAQVREAGGVAPLEATLADWRDRLTRRGRAMLTGAAALAAYLQEHGDDPRAG